MPEVAAKAADDPNLLTVQLTQQDGSWSFAGDGRASFVPPLAPLPVDENPQARRWSKGNRVEVGPVDEAYVGSWYAGQIAAFAGGNQGGVDALEVRRRERLLRLRLALGVARRAQFDNAPLAGVGDHLALGYL